MKYPCLVPKRLCKTPISVHLESEELTEDGNPKYCVDLELLCNWQDKAKTILTAEKKLIQITGTAAPSQYSEKRAGLNREPRIGIQMERLTFALWR